MRHKTGLKTETKKLRRIKHGWKSFFSEQENQPQEQLHSMSSHLGELRKRCIYCALCFVGSFAFFLWNVAFLREKLETMVKKFLPPTGEIAFLNITEAFMVDLQLAITFALFITIPFLFIQLWKFVAPGLYPSERKGVLPAAFFTAVFFFLGLAFSYTIMLPFSLSFFISYGASTIKPVIALENIFDFTLSLLLTFALIFELPIVCFFLAKLRIISANKLKQLRKYAIITAFIVAAFITPPTVYTQFFVAVPLLLLYEVSILVTSFVEKHHQKTT